jgi:hypothetical protein
MGGDVSVIMKKLCIIAIILFYVVPCKVWGNGLALKDFFAPTTGITNIYSCNFPCDSLEVVGDLSSNNRKLTLREKMHLSEKLTKGNDGIPKIINKTKNLLLLDDRIVAEGSDKISNILIKGPIENKLSWKIHGIKETLIGERASSGVNKEKVSWSCRVIDYGKDQCLSELREVVKIECESDFKPKELIRYNYAAEIGLIEKTTINAANGHETNKIKILKSIRQ